jgi:hypothetical protein
VTVQEIELEDASGDILIVSAFVGKRPILEIDSDDGGGVATLDQRKATELAAILLHFADTGELPGEVGDGQ